MFYKKYRYIVHTPDISDKFLLLCGGGTAWFVSAPFYSAEVQFWFVSVPFYAAEAQFYFVSALFCGAETQF